MRLNEMNNPNYAPGLAYWVSPKGEILDIAGGTHIQHVIQHPEKYGYTKEKIDAWYEKHGENQPSEGKAREEIVLDLARRGWLRIRFYARPNYAWSVTMRDSNRSYENFKNWAHYQSQRKDIPKTFVKGDVNLTFVARDGSIHTEHQGMLDRLFPLDEMMYMEKTFRVVESAADFEGNYDILTEASIGRAYQHLQNDEIPVAFITAFRGGQENREENIRRNQHLAAQIRKAGYGYFFIDGGWIENAGTPEEIAVEEDSIFIAGRPADNGRLKGLVKQWMKQYDQDGVLIKPEGETDVHLLLNNGEDINIGSFSTGTAEEGFSRIRGREFHFEGIRRPEKNWISKLANK